MLIKKNSHRIIVNYSGENFLPRELVMSAVEEILAKFAARERENRDEEIITWNFSAHFPAAALRSFISSDLGWEESNSTHSFSSHSSLFMSNIRHRHCRLLFK